MNITIFSTKRSARKGVNIIRRSMHRDSESDENQLSNAVVLVPRLSQFILGGSWNPSEISMLLMNNLGDGEAISRIIIESGAESPMNSPKSHTIRNGNVFNFDQVDVDIPNNPLPNRTPSEMLSNINTDINTDLNRKIDDLTHIITDMLNKGQARDAIELRKSLELNATNLRISQELNATNLKISSDLNSTNIRIGASRETYLHSIGRILNVPEVANPRLAGLAVFPVTLIGAAAVPELVDRALVLNGYQGCETPLKKMNSYLESRQEVAEELPVLIEPPVLKKLNIIQKFGNWIAGSK
jgi:hypothetical protein